MAVTQESATRARKNRVIGERFIDSNILQFFAEVMGVSFFLCGPTECGWHAVVNADAFGGVIGGHDDDFVVRELLFAGVDRVGVVFCGVDGGFVYLRFCFGGRNGCGGEVGVDELDTAFETGDAELELVDLAVDSMGDGAGAVELLGGAGHSFAFIIGAAGNGEIPLRREAVVEAGDLPVGGGDFLDDGLGDLVDGLVDCSEFPVQAVVGAAIFVGEDGVVRREG